MPIGGIVAIECISTIVHPVYTAFQLLFFYPQGAMGFPGMLGQKVRNNSQQELFEFFLQNYNFPNLTTMNLICCAG